VLNPHALWGLLLLIPMIALSVHRYKVGWRTYLALSGDPNQHPWFFWRHICKSIALMGTFCCLILAKADIHSGQTEKRYRSSGLDIAIIMDISFSMLGDDVEPMRLDVAKNILQEVLFGLEGLNFGVVLFKGAALTAIPLTTDTGLIDQFIQNVQSSWISEAGTNVADAIQQSLALFSADSDRKKVAILISDGEILTGDVRASLRQAFHEDVTIFTVGVGTPEGAHLRTETGELRYTKHGSPLISTLEEGPLQTIAQITGGIYFNASQSNVSHQLISALKQYETTEYHLEQRPRSLFVLFIFIGLVLLLSWQIIRSLSWNTLFGAHRSL
jgi:Ca-activated chloride channel family protein